MLSQIGATTSFTWLFAAYVVFGIGFGFVNAPITNAAVSGMPRAQAGVASAIASTSRQVGATLGVAVVGALLASSLGRSAGVHAAVSTACRLVGPGRVRHRGPRARSGGDDAVGAPDGRAHRPRAQPRVPREAGVTAAGRRRATTPKDAAARAWSVMCDLVLDNERRREVSDALGLTFGRVRALRRIAASSHDHGGAGRRPRDRAPYATLVVDELERQGLVERRPHPTDRRVKLVATTARGTAAARRANEILDRLPAGLARLSEPEIEELARILDEVARSRAD